MNRYQAIDCFAGAGGLSLGLHQAGFSVGAAFDNDPDAVATYRASVGNILQSPASELDADRLLKEAGLSFEDCDLVAGGPPCQGFSVQRRGSDHDSRNELVLDFFRIVSEIRPTFFLMENVAAIQGKRGQGILERLRSLAAESGYMTCEKVLDAADFGVPQHRRRFFLVGARDGAMDGFAWPEPSASIPPTVRDAIGDLPKPLRDPTELGIPNHELDNMSELNRKRISFVPEGGGREDIPEDLQLPCHRVSVSKAGYRGVFGRLAWDRPAGTITTKCNSFTRGRFAHPEQNRNITMREAARIQGFPDDFVFRGSRVAVAHQVGNAVPPGLAQAVGASIYTALERHHDARGS